MKTINELLGVSFGHNVLRRVSEILRSQLLKQEQCYIGDGGLFYLVSWDISKEKVESRLKELIEKIQAGDCAQGKYNILICDADGFSGNPHDCGNFGWFVCH